MGWQAAWLSRGSCPHPQVVQAEKNLNQDQRQLWEAHQTLSVCGVPIRVAGSDVPCQAPGRFVTASDRALLHAPSGLEGAAPNHVQELSWVASHRRLQILSSLVVVCNHEMFGLLRASRATASCPGVSTTPLAAALRHLTREAQISRCGGRKEGAIGRAGLRLCRPCSRNARMD